MLPMPEGNISALQADINALKGANLLVPSTSGGWDQGAAAAPREDWQPRRLGANPPAPLVDLRSGVGEHVIAACGVPPSMLGRSDGTLARESWRQFLHGSVRPVAEMVAEQLAEKLDTPDLAFSFESLQASDISGRAAGVRFPGASRHGLGAGGDRRGPPRAVAMTNAITPPVLDRLIEVVVTTTGPGFTPYRYDGSQREPFPARDVDLNRISVDGGALRFG